MPAAGHFRRVGADQSMCLPTARRKLKRINRPSSLNKKMATSFNIAVLVYTGVVRASMSSSLPARLKRVACLQSNAAGIQAWRAVVCEQMAPSRVGEAVMVVKKDPVQVSLWQAGLLTVQLLNELLVSGKLWR
jgi:hypothetical protein